MKLEIKEIDGVPVTGIPGGSRTVLGMLTMHLAWLHVTIFKSHFASYSYYKLNVF